MTRHIALYVFLLIPICAQMPGENIPLQNFEVSEFTKLNTAQRSEIAITGGHAIVHGILTSVGMSYCTIQDPHSFQSITCGYDPAVRAEYYAQRPGTAVSLIGIPVVGSGGQLTLSETRIFDANHPVLSQQPTLQNVTMETTNIPASPGARENAFAPPNEPTAAAPARTNSEAPTHPITEVTEGNPQFIRRAVPRREGVGRSASLYVGGTFAQTGDGSSSIPTTTAPGFGGSNALDTRSQGGMSIGAKFSYTMALKNNEGNPQPVMPGLEAEMLYSNFNYRANISNNAAASAEYRTDMDIFALLGNGTLKFNLTPFFPYIGAGAGFAYVSAQNAQLTASTTGTSQSLRDTDAVTLAAQGFMGLEYMLSKDWSVFGEYKYLHLQGLNFDQDKTRIDYDFLGLHYLNIGVRNYF